MPVLWQLLLTISNCHHALTLTPIFYLRAKPSRSGVHQFHPSGQQRGDHLYLRSHGSSPWQTHFLHDALMALHVLHPSGSWRFAPLAGTVGSSSGLYPVHYRETALLPVSSSARVHTVLFPQQDPVLLLQSIVALWQLDISRFSCTLPCLPRFFFPRFT